MADDDFYTAPTDPLLGKILDDRYQVLRKLGEGGMGAVYEGLHMRIKRRVAIKTLHPHIAMHEEALKRFHREAMAATATGSPHVVECTDMGTAPDGQLYMVLEFLEGRNLGDEIAASGPMPVGRAAHILCQVCDALSAVHAKGIVHRDLKPDNLFLVHRPGEPDFVKVLDFGISKFTTSPDGTPTQMTGEGMALGTAHFMSPEQAEGRANVDHRTDIYALGGILYQVLTGTTPFEAETFAMLVLKVVTEPAPLVRARRTDVPAALQELVRRCLEKSPDERPQNVDEVKAVLAPLRTVMDAPAFSVPPPAPPKIDTPEAFTGTVPASDVRAAVRAQATPTPAEAQPVSAPPRMTPLRWQPVALSVALAGVLATAVLWALPGDGPAAQDAVEAGDEEAAPPDPTPVVADTAPSDAPEPAPAARVRLRASTRPAEAQLFLDERAVENPLDVQVDRDDDPHLLEARLEGYETRSEPLTFDSDLAVRLTLVPVRPAPDPRRARSVRSAPRRAAQAEPEAAPSEPSQPAPVPPAAQPEPAEPTRQDDLKRVRF